MKLKSLVPSLALQQIKEVGAVAKQESVTLVPNIECTCKMQWYTILILSLSILGFVFFCHFEIKKTKTVQDICSLMQLKLCFSYQTLNIMYQSNCVK